MGVSWLWEDTWFRGNVFLSWQDQFRKGARSCFVLLVLALGVASYEKAIGLHTGDIETPGMTYFSAAWALLSTLIASRNVLSSQCSISSCEYLIYLVRSLEA